MEGDGGTDRLELTTLAAIGEEIPQMHEFLTAAYSHPTTLDLVRANDVEKIKQVFAEYTVFLHLR